MWHLFHIDMLICRRCNFKIMIYHVFSAISVVFFIFVSLFWVYPKSFLSFHFCFGPFSLTVRLCHKAHKIFVVIFLVSCQLFFLIFNSLDSKRNKPSYIRFWECSETVKNWMVNLNSKILMIKFEWKQLMNQGI